MDIGKKYKLTGEPYNVIVEELKTVSKIDKDQNGKSIKGEDGKVVKKTNEEWKVGAYCISLESALNYIAKKEINTSIGEDFQEVFDKIEELKEELPKIALKILEGAEIIKKVEPKKKEKKKKREVEEEYESGDVDISNDFVKWYEQE